MDKFKGNFKDGIFTVKLISRIDAANASDAEKEIFDLRQSNKDGALVLDASELEYISSAGLRVILRLLKTERNLKLTNASPSIYDILDTTGFTEMMSVEKAYRCVSVEGCEVIGKGANGTIYRLDEDTIVKTYHSYDSLDDMQNEREIARKAFILGIPTAIPYDIVRVGSTHGAVFEMLNAKSITKMIKDDPENIDKYIGMYVDLMKKIHSTVAGDGEFPDVKVLASSWVEFIKGEIEEPLWEKLRKLMDEIPATDHVIHGDYHTNNVMVQNGEVLLIDMDTLSLGHPVFELASVFNACVGFSSCDDEVSMRFFNLSRKTTVYIWEKTLSLYLGTDDKDIIKSVEEKTMIVGYTRLLRRSLKREVDTEAGRKLIAFCKQRLTELLPRVDSLYF